MQEGAFSFGALRRTPSGAPSPNLDSELAEMSVRPAPGLAPQCRPEQRFYGALAARPLKQLPRDQIGKLSGAASPFGLNKVHKKDVTRLPDR